MEADKPLDRRHVVAQTPRWYDSLATLQEGYYYPWRSVLPSWHGEDIYLELVRQHTRLDADVLDVASGHGGTSLAIASQVRSVLGYDRTAAWIDMAQRAARESSITNATFACHDSSPAAHGGRARLPSSLHLEGRMSGLVGAMWVLS